MQRYVRYLARTDNWCPGPLSTSVKYNIWTLVCFVLSADHSLTPFSSIPYSPKPNEVCGIMYLCMPLAVINVIIGRDNITWVVVSFCLRIFLPTLSTS